MGIRLQNVTFKSADPMRLAEFWSQVLGWVITDYDDDEIEIQAPPGTPEHGLVPDLVILRAPDEKSGPNTVHIDLRPDDDQEEHVRRIEALGARRIDIGQGPDATWVVLADPDGNEFCVLRKLRPDELTP